MIIGIKALQHRVGIVYFFLVIIGHIETGFASYTDGDVVLVGQQLYGRVGLKFLIDVLAAGGGKVQRGTIDLHDLENTYHGTCIGTDCSEGYVFVLFEEIESFLHISWSVSLVLVLTPAAANIGILLFLHLYDNSRV